MRATRRAARAIETELHPDGILLLQRNGEAAGQEVFHYHLHIIPRASGTPYPPESWLPFTPVDERANLGRRLRAAMTEPP